MHALYLCVCLELYASFCCHGNAKKAHLAAMITKYSIFRQVCSLTGIKCIKNRSWHTYALLLINPLFCGPHFHLMKSILGRLHVCVCFWWGLWMFLSFYIKSVVFSRCMHMLADTQAEVWMCECGFGSLPTQTCLSVMQY